MLFANHALLNETEAYDESDRVVKLVHLWIWDKLGPIEI